MSNSTFRLVSTTMFAAATLMGCQAVPLDATVSSIADSKPAVAPGPGAMPAPTIGLPPAPAAATRPSEAAIQAALLTPIIERREAFTATGYASISVQNHKTPAQQRLLAIRASRLDAYRALAEQVYGQHLDATTTVSQLTVTSDTFRARVEGVIFGAVLVSITPIGEDTYETTLSLDRAVVEDLRALYLSQLAARQAARRVP